MGVAKTAYFSNKAVNKEVTIATTHHKHFTSHITHIQHKDQLLDS